MLIGTDTGATGSVTVGYKGRTRLCKWVCDWTCEDITFSGKIYYQSPPFLALTEKNQYHAISPNITRHKKVNNGFVYPSVSMPHWCLCVGCWPTHKQSRGHTHAHARTERLTDDTLRQFLAVFPLILCLSCRLLPFVIKAGNTFPLGLFTGSHLSLGSL